ncbi:MAG: energy transducer TonB [Kistimonas sp.]|nr:energy transducer TonB [Kistimonas sp.]
MTTGFRQAGHFWSGDTRLWSVCLVCAAAMHLALLFGLAFVLEPSARPPRALEITLARFPSSQAPDRADYLAQENQIGSGTVEDDVLPSNDQQAPFQSEVPAPVMRQQEPLHPPPGAPEISTQLTVRRPDASAAAPRQLVPWGVAGPEKRPEPSVDPDSDIASLEADFLEKRQAYARRPVIHRMNTASTRKADILYQEAWRRKVMQVGTVHYPARAREKRIYGELRLAVQIRRNGSLEKVEIVHSSGHKVLDDAALRIVRLAAPFASFPPELQSYDMIEIIRTWRFEPGGLLRD